MGIILSKNIHPIKITLQSSLLHGIAEWCYHHHLKIKLQPSQHHSSSFPWPTHCSCLHHRRRHSYYRSCCFHYCHRRCRRPTTIVITVVIVSTVVVVLTIVAVVVVFATSCLCSCSCGRCVAVTFPGKLQENDWTRFNGGRSLVEGFVGFARKF